MTKKKSAFAQKKADEQAPTVKTVPKKEKTSDLKHLDKKCVLVREEVMIVEDTAAERIKSGEIKSSWLDKKAREIKASKKKKE